MGQRGRCPGVKSLWHRELCGNSRNKANRVMTTRLLAGLWQWTHAQVGSERCVPYAAQMDHALIDNHLTSFGKEMESGAPAAQRPAARQHGTRDAVAHHEPQPLPADAPVQRSQRERLAGWQARLCCRRGSRWPCCGTEKRPYRNFVAVTSITLILGFHHPLGGPLDQYGKVAYPQFLLDPGPEGFDCFRADVHLFGNRLCGHAFAN
jgi:hypothetical protein